MYVIRVQNVNEALPIGLQHLRAHGVHASSRNGPVLVAPEPVTTVYEKPWQRVLFSPERDANPFFHLVESVWMLAGRNSVRDLTPYVRRMQDFSDNGETLWGAYGDRWRTWFGSDQLLWVINQLKNDPTDRRAVLSMWDCRMDVFRASIGGRDVPCNTHIYPTIGPQGLSLTVCCRSNDIIWGAYGANAVHFSVLQEFLASAINVPMGPLYQVSNNFHAYVDVMEKYGECQAEQRDYPLHQPLCLATIDPKDFLEQCELLFSSSTDLAEYQPSNEWLRQTVRPAMLAHRAYRAKRWDTAFSWASRIADEAWAEACHQWLQRRQAAALRAADDGVSYE